MWNSPLSNRSSKKISADAKDSKAAIKAKHFIVLNDLDFTAAKLSGYL